MEVYTGHFLMKSTNEQINKLKILKLLSAIFIMGALLLSAASFLIVHQSAYRWILLGLYTWSGALFLIYKITQLTKDIKQNGAIEK